MKQIAGCIAYTEAVNYNSVHWLSAAFSQSVPDSLTVSTLVTVVDDKAGREKRFPGVLNGPQLESHSPERVAIIAIDEDEDEVARAVIFNRKGGALLDFSMPEEIYKGWRHGMDGISTTCIRPGPR